MHPRDRAAHAAVAHVGDGMIVGLGSGDTASRAIRLLAGRRIVGVATSEGSAALARSLGIALRAPEEVAAGTIDLTIDGADEIDPELRLIKGGGAAHTREKLVAHASSELIIVADAAQARGAPRREHASARRDPALRGCAGRWRALAALALDPPAVRAGVVTDNGNLLADCALGPVDDLARARRRHQGARPASSSTACSSTRRRSPTSARTTVSIA